MRRRRAELHLHVQLRRLPDRHRQPARVQPALLQHRRPLPLRHDLLPPPHGTLLRRPPRRRLPRASVRAAAAAAVPVAREGRPAGRQLRRGRRHGHGSALLRGDRGVGQALDQPVPQRAARLVREAQAFTLQLTQKFVAAISLLISRIWGSISTTGCSLQDSPACLFKIGADCKKYFSRSLFLVGEIGGNDYNYAFFKGKTLDDAKSYVPTVSSAIIDATERLIKGGAMHLVVPGNLPMGCSSAYLTLHPGRSRGDYDAVGCLKTYNDFAQRHNAMVQQKLQVLRLKYPEARIMYADYYGAAMAFAKNPKQFGFKEGPLKTCCGGGGPYNFNPKASCGVRGSSVCADPSAYANWDGVHLTEAAYHAIADSILHGPYTSPRLL
ncbi:unnamed protein product [Triticum turgidum subsp. durum]|uniref:GDSL esterase/lipase n=1 Tax=Triticum turgidum subsp. durum TaxID=4567 RepID=A0A9R1RZQ5_TRITD|nr:unnamed protein product [Triticum turgidum subsp. durum]